MAASLVAFSVNHVMNKKVQKVSTKRRPAGLVNGLPRTFRAVWWGVVLLAAGPVAAWAAETRDPLLELMIQKGMVTQEEAVKVRAEADALLTNTPAASSMTPSKWKISEAIKSLQLFGDIRFRYEDRTAQDPNGGQIELQRERYALRLGLRGDIYDDFYFGLRLETGANGRSPWLTAGSSATASPVYQGPFGKSTAGINLGQAYLGGRFGDWLDVTVGKMPNPLYTTPMVWDGDLSPEGLVERFKFPVGHADFFVTLGQFLYEDTNPNTASGGFFGSNDSYPSQNGGSSSPGFLLAWQGGVNYHFTPKVSAKVAPVLYTYAGGGGQDTTQSGSLGSPGFGGTFVGQGATNGVGGVPAYGWSGYPGGYYDGFNANQTGINDLMVLEIPWEVNFKIAKLNAKIFGDYAYNLQGSQRAEAAYAAANNSSGFLPGANGGIGGVRSIPSAQTRDVHAYQVGFALGNGDLGLVYGTTAKKRTWEARLYWQHIEQYALDPNLLDSDFFEGRANLEGIFASVSYALTDNLLGTIRYGWAHRINDKLGTGGSNQDIPQMNPVDRYQIIQADVTLKF